MMSEQIILVFRTMPNPPRGGGGKHQVFKKKMAELPRELSGKFGFFIVTRRYGKRDQAYILGD